MDLREQEYVVALARHQSITKAAEELYISQPTLSIFLNRLEERMGVPLFDRVGKRLVPTCAGALYVRSAREMLAIQNEFRGELNDMIQGSAGRLRLGLHLRRSRYPVSYTHLTVAGEVKDSLASSYTVYSSTFFGYFRIYSRTWFSAAERLR